jgi:hypothetical protein
MSERQFANVCREAASSKSMKRNMTRFRTQIGKIERAATYCENDYQFKFNRKGFEKDLGLMIAKNLSF